MFLNYMGILGFRFKNWPLKTQIHGSPWEMHGKDGGREWGVAVGILNGRWAAALLIIFCD
jgi:hypothetical protein